MLIAREFNHQNKLNSFRSNIDTVPRVIYWRDDSLAEINFNKILYVLGWLVEASLPIGVRVFAQSNPVCCRSIVQLKGCNMHSTENKGNYGLFIHYILKETEILCTNKKSWFRYPEWSNLFLFSIFMQKQREIHSHNFFNFIAVLAEMCTVV